MRRLPHLAHSFGISYRVRPLLRALGLDLRPIESTLDGQRSALLESMGVRLVLDGGAHVGEYGRRIRSWGYREHIMSFEPNPESFRRLAQVAASDSQWDVFNVGLSNAPGYSQLFLHGGADSPFNSLHATSDAGHSVAGGSASTVDVELDTLDNLLSSLRRVPPTLLKLDLQGHEVSALRGAQRTLESCIAVEVEVPMSNALYAESASTQEEIFEHLTGAGFQAIAFHTERWFNGSPPDIDVLFRRTS